jgi:multicomponent Na+:H+ antiporter subunit E
MRTLIRRVVHFCEFLLFFLWELVLANLRLARDVVGPVSRLRPGIVAVPLDVTGDAEVAVLANLLTLTPGTLSLDVSSDGKVLYVHAVSAADPQALRAGIKAGFEQRVRRLFS